MNYQIIIEPEAQQDLKAIFEYISKNDTINRAKVFLYNLQTAIDSLSFMPQRCRDSHYIDDGKTKDLIYHGYTICYHIVESTVYIVAIFRQR